MIPALLFWALTFTCCGFAALFGGKAGRRIGGLYILACLATLAAWFTQFDWHHTHYAIFAVDCVLLVALFVVAMQSDRWFPIWFAGLHTVAIASHFASIVAPDFAPKIYFLLQAFWSIPMLLLLVVGVARDRQAGIVDELSASRPDELRAGGSAQS